MKILKSEYARIKLILCRMMYTDSGAQNVTATYPHYILSTVIFPKLI